MYAERMESWGGGKKGQREWDGKEEGNERKTFRRGKEKHWVPKHVPGLKESFLHAAGTQSQAAESVRQRVCSRLQLQSDISEEAGKCSGISMKHVRLQNSKG